MPEITIKLVIETNDAETKISTADKLVSDVKSNIEKPANLKVSAEQALATIRDVKIAFDGVIQVVSGVVNSMNEYMDASLEARQSAILAKIAFGEYAGTMSEFAGKMQSVTNFEGDQLLALMSKMAQTFKLNTSEIESLTPAILDFAEANKATGMTVESAFDLMGRAVNGHTEMLGRYGIELDETKIKSEGVSYLVQKLSADYGGTAQALADLRLQNENTWGDVKESIGDMLTVMIQPLLKGLKALFDWYNDLGPVMKGFVTGIAIMVPAVAVLTTAISALTVAFTALKVAINPVAGIISIIVGLIATLGFAYASAKLANDNATTSQENYSGSINKTTESMDKLITKQREMANSIDYEEAVKRLKAISTEIDNYLAKFNVKRNFKLIIDLSHEFDYDKYNNMLAQEQALKEKINAEDKKAYSEFYSEKIKTEKETSLTGLELLEYRLQNEKKHYAELGKLNAQNTEEKIESFRKIKQLEAEIKEKKKENLEALQELEKRYSILSITDLTQQKEKELEIERDSELAHARALGASEETLLRIREVFERKTTEVESNVSEQRKQKLEQETKDKAKLLEEQTQKEEELAQTKFEFMQTGLSLQDNDYQAQLNSIDNFYAKRKDKLLQSGLTEQQITNQMEMAKNRIREQFEQKHLQGLSSTLGNLAKTSQAFGAKGFALWKTFAMAQALVDTYSSANGAYKAMAGIPVVGPGLAIAAAAAAIGAGLANVAVIAKTEPPKAEKGGMIFGKSHAQGGVLLEAEGEEYITAKDRVKLLGKRFFDFINFAPIRDVQLAFAGLPMPSIPLPDTNIKSSIFASGGIVESGRYGIESMLDKLSDMADRLLEIKEEIKNKNLSLNVQVDPLSNDPVKISELADKGKIIRSEF